MNFRQRRTTWRAADATRSWTKAGVYTGGRTSIWRLTAISSVAKPARHPEAAKKELETIGARRHKAISTEEIRRRARFFLRNLQRADLRGSWRRLCFRPGQPVLVAKSRNDQGPAFPAPSGGPGQISQGRARRDIRCGGRSAPRQPQLRPLVFRDVDGRWRRTDFRAARLRAWLLHA